MAENKPAGEKETILLVGSERSQVARLERELRSSGYPLLASIGAEVALKTLSERPVHLIIVMGPGSGRIAERKNSDGRGGPGGAFAPATERSKES